MNNVDLLLRMHNDKHFNLNKMSRGEMSMMIKEHGFKYADFVKARMILKDIVVDSTSVWQKDGF